MVFHQYFDIIWSNIEPIFVGKNGKYYLSLNFYKTSGFEEKEYCLKKYNLFKNYIYFEEYIKLFIIVNVKLLIKVQANSFEINCLFPILKCLKIKNISLAINK